MACRRYYVSSIRNAPLTAGIAILISIVGESPEREQTIRFAGVSEHFQKIFDMVGLTRYIKIFPSEEAALEGF